MYEIADGLIVHWECPSVLDISAWGGTKHSVQFLAFDCWDGGAHLLQDSGNIAGIDCWLEAVAVDNWCSLRSRYDVRQRFIGHLWDCCSHRLEDAGGEIGAIEG